MFEVQYNDLMMADMAETARHLYNKYIVVLD